MITKYNTTIKELIYKIRLGLLYSLKNTILNRLGIDILKIKVRVFYIFFLINIRYSIKVNRDKSKMSKRSSRREKKIMQNSLVLLWLLFTIFIVKINIKVKV